MKNLNKKGFSLVELLAAIAILAILMTVATQAYNVYKRNARQQAYDTMAKSATTATTNYLMENTNVKYISLEDLKEKQYIDTLQDPRYKDKECSGIVINKVMPGETQKQLDVLFQKVKLCCKNYKYQYDYTGDDVKVTEIESCEYVEGDEIDGVYKLIYKPLGGTECDPAVVIKNQREEWGPLCVTTKENAIFKGWNTKKNGSGSYITEHTKVGDKDINAYAIWSVLYKLTYDVDGGSLCDPDSIIKGSGEKWGNLCESTKSGYAFKGWTTKKNGAGTKITKNSTVEKDITVYAHWNPYYTLTFDSTGGTACSANTITEENGNKWGTLCTTTKENYVFAGWNTKKDGTGEKVTEDTKASSNITVYAIWNPKYKITFNSNGGTACNPATIVQEKGKEWGTLCKTTKTGYDFSRWKDQDGKTITSTSKVEKDLTLTAEWSAKEYTLKYDNNGGDGCTSSKGKYDSAWGDLCQPTRSGYTFSGWKDNTTAVTNETICKGDRSVKASWTKKCDEGYVLENGTCKKIHETYAIFSETDGSLTFVRTRNTITPGEYFEGIYVTDVFKVYEDKYYPTQSYVEWYDIRDQVKKVIFRDTIKPIGTQWWFCGMSYCEYYDLKKLDTSNVVRMFNMFHAASNSVDDVYLDLSTFDTSNVETIRSIFLYFGSHATNSVSVNVTGWDIRKITDLSGIFFDFGRRAKNVSIIGLETWDTSNVTDMSKMFIQCAEEAYTFSIGDIGGWNTSNVTNMERMFCEMADDRRPAFSLDLSGWDVSKVTNHSLFRYNIFGDKIIEPNWVS